MGEIVFARTNLSGHSGAGIVIAENPNQLVAAPLYVKYVKKLQEFRVHVAFGRVIDVQEKRRSSAATDINSRIRSHDNGWVFCRDNIRQPTGLGEIAVQAAAAVGLDFGAVDIIYNQRQNQLYVLEINTAPGLEGQTVLSYGNAIWNKLNERIQSR